MRIVRNGQFAGASCAIAAVVLAAASAAAVDESQVKKPARPPRYIEVLRAHHKRLATLDAELDRLRESIHRPRARIADAGSRLLAEGIAFRGTLEAFESSSVSGDFKQERDLIGASAQAMHDMLCKYRQLAGLDTPRPTEHQKRQIRNRMELLIGDIAKAKVAARLQAEGLRVLLNRDGREEVCGRTALHVKRKVQQWLKRRLEEVSNSKLYDAASATRVLREDVYREVERRFASLVVKLTPDQLLITLAQQTVIRLQGEALQKLLSSLGDFETRAAEPLALAAEIAGGLRNLPKDASQVHVWEKVRRAEGTLAALRHLFAHAKGPTDVRLGGDLKAAAAELEESMSLVRRRFRLRNQELLEEMDRTVAFLVEILDEIRKLGVVVKVPVEKPTPLETETRQWYVTHKYQILTEWVARRGSRSAVAQSSSVSMAPELWYIDLEKLAQRRAYLRDKGRKPEEAEFARFATRYGRSYLVRVTCNGQTRSVYYTFGSRGRRGRRFGTDYCHGLTEGHHTAVVTVVTSEGFRLDDTFTIGVELKGSKRLPKVKLAAERSRHVMARLRGKRRANYAQEHIKALLAHGNELTVYGTVMSEDLLAIAQECADALDLIPTRSARADRREEDYFAEALSIVEFCEKTSDQGAYHLALSIAGRAEMNADSRKEKSRVAEMYQAVAHLAIGGCNDVNAARAHLEKWLELREAAGYVYTESQKQAERKTWPTKIEIAD